MEVIDFGKIERNKPKHQAEVSMQTGFPSPATHYMETSVDLSEILVKNREATFYVRIAGDTWKEFQIYKNDILIIDRSLDFVKGKMALVVKEGNFEVMKYPYHTDSERGEVAPFDLWGVITHIIHQL